MTGAPEQVAIVGAGASGISTAVALRAFGYTGEIVVIGDETELPYDRPPLSKQILKGDWTLDDIRFHPAEHYADQAITLLSGSAARSLDVPRLTVRLADGSDVTAGAVVIATGVRPRSHPALDKAAGLHTVSSAADAHSLRASLRPGAKVVVLGAGFLGLEIAASAVSLGCSVDIVERGPLPLAGRIPVEVSRRLTSLHESHGVRFHLDSNVDEFITEDGRVTGVRLDDGEIIDADLTVVAIGSTPNVEWLRSSGLDIDGGVASDAHGRVADGVYAVGDIARVYDDLSGREQRREHRSNASESALIVASAILGRDIPAPAVPSFWTDQYDVKLQFVGAVTAGADVVLTEGELDSNRFAGTVSIGGRLIGAFAWNSPRSLIPHRRELALTPAKGTTHAGPR